MQNKLLSITRNIIPYVKELRPIAGSVTAVLLWQQLDYWFARSSDGFYKFLSPPQSEHEKYRLGDSWTEELGFSEFEFRNAFDKIGVRHTSKGAYDKSENPFMRKGKEFYFCSYHDKQKGLTFYFRNHALADKALDSLVKSEPLPVTKDTQVTEINPVTKDTSFTEIENVKLQNLRNSSSTIYTDTTPDNNNIKTVDDDNLKVIFSDSEQPAAKKILSLIPKENQLEVLAVLLVMIKTKNIDNKAAYLRAIVKSVQDGTFTPLPEKNKPVTSQERIKQEKKKKQESDQRAKTDNAAWAAELEAKYGDAARKAISNNLN